MSRTSSSWLPLGSAHLIDWKHLGRPAGARGANAWVTSLEGESTLIRVWGEDATSYFDFVMLSDERVAGTIVVTCARADGNRLRLKTEVEVDGLVSYTDTADFRENARTLMLSTATRSFESRRGGLTEHTAPVISAQAAELFEIAPDSAMQTSCAEWLAAIIGVCRDVVRGKDAPEAVAPAETKNGKAEPAPKKDPAPARSRTEAARPNQVREALDGQPRRVSPSASAEVSRERAVPAEVAPSSRTIERTAERSAERAERAPAPAAVTPPPSSGGSKLSCSTNSGETFEITGDETFIGRSKQCAIVLKSQRVSRKHACVTKEADGFYINDLGAANGIWAGSEKIDREKIQSGEEFIIGDVVLTFTLS